MKDRLVSLDAYRGFIMLAMVSGGMGMHHLLNDPTWGWLADQFEHRDWEGCTFWDLIQPAFMFMVGASMPFAFAKRRERGESWSRQLGHVVQRSLTLIAIGVFLDSFGQTLPYVQFIRVLQQIAIGYFLAFFFLHGGPYVQALGAAGILVLHTGLYLLFGLAVGCYPWEPGYNIGTQLDRWLFLPVSTGNYATLNALSSTATILFGVLAGELLRSDWTPRQKSLALFLAGLLGLALGAGLTPWTPMIKRIWTASFALFAGGWTCWMMLAFYGLFDVIPTAKRSAWINSRRWAWPLVVVGVNSIAIYVVSSLLSPAIRDGLKPFVTLPLSFAPKAAPVLLAALMVAAKWLFCYWLYRRQIFFKV